MSRYYAMLYAKVRDCRIEGSVYARSPAELAKKIQVFFKKAAKHKGRAYVRLP